MVSALPGTPTLTPSLPPLPRKATAPWRAASNEAEPETCPTADVIRRRVRGTLQRMATQVEAHLPQALETAGRAWERTGSMALLDEESMEMMLLARQELRAAVQAGEPGTVALAVEGLWALRTAFAVVSLLEARLPALIRMRARVQDREWLPGGRPFLDLAPALSELARRWA